MTQIMFYSCMDHITQCQADQGPPSDNFREHIGLRGFIHKTFSLFTLVGGGDSKKLKKRLKKMFKIVLISYFQLP